MYGNGVRAYHETNVLTADPKKLVIMCYEGAITNLKIARERYLSGKYEAKAKAMQKAQDIISELMQALDFEKGGEIAKNLDTLYNYMQRRLLDVEAKRDTKAVDEVICMLEELKEAWEEAFYGDKENIKAGSYVAEESSGQVVGATQ
ncbi:MAG: flagellar export chaperone FliS [Desulfobacterales bacterium]|nr:flagellar export chaperone FliS [Desulfobacterales bacterium]